jgi:hypothetical protein
MRLPEPPQRKDEQKVPGLGCFALWALLTAIALLVVYALQH